MRGVPRARLARALMGSTLVVAIGGAIVLTDREADLGSPRPTGAETAIDELDGVLTRLVSGCMESAGFAHLEQVSPAMAEVAERPRLLLAWDPAESIPTSQDEAREFGLIGLSSLFKAPFTWEVDGRADDFHRQFDSCVDELERSIGVEIRQGQQGWFDLAQRIRSDFVARVKGDASLLAAELQVCLVDAYPFIDLADDFESMLEKQGITPGEQRIPDRVLALDASGVRIYLVGRPVYLPSPGEVTLAEAFVDCAGVVDFARRLDEIQQAPREILLQEYEDELAYWEAWATETVGKLVRR